jgi:hypothetical protein
MKSQTTEDKELSPEEVSTWAAKAMGDTSFELDIFKALPDQDRRYGLLRKGFPPELFTEPAYSLFLAELLYRRVEALFTRLLKYAVIQDFKYGYKANIFVRLIRRITWNSFKERLVSTDFAEQIRRKVHRIKRKAPKHKGKHVIPFWFRNFDDRLVNLYIRRFVESITSNLETADGYMVKYINATHQKDENAVDSKEQ